MDRAVQRTDQDALASKVSAVSKGYYDDKYLKYFLGIRQNSDRLPLMNIGTYCRVWAVDSFVEKFLARTAHCPKRQIVSLGAGSDTRAYKVLETKPPGLVYHELDFPEMVTKKRRQIQKSPEVCDIIGLSISSANDPGQGIDTAAYHLHGIDLRKLRSNNAPVVEKNVPCLVISECCLCYLKPDESREVLRYFEDEAGGPEFFSCILYEPICLDDEFGRVMASNLAHRGLSLPSFELYSTLDAQKKRLADLGLKDILAITVEDIYKHSLSDQDRHRVTRLEFLDEVEEMFLLLRHYCVVSGWGS